MPVKPLGSDWDARGCVLSAGYQFCEILGKCIRSWEESCEIPDNCLTWNDGCNMCGVQNGELTFCSEMACFTMSNPECVVWRPEPIIDYPMPMPMPPLVNPFISDGH
jgi:hypothetical protein